VSVLASLLVAIAVVVGGPGLVAPAAAHTALVGMTPADGSTVTTAPTQVVLTFDEAVEQVGDAVVVTAPSGARVGSGAPVVDGSLVTQQLVALTEPGRYTVAYRVVSDDGHPVTGSLGFTLAATSVSPTPATSSSAASSAAPQTQASSSSSADPVAGASPIGPMIVGALVLLALAAGAALFSWRRNRR
jgi:methionine-rich copper-binding protein CopC